MAEEPLAEEEQRSTGLARVIPAALVAIGLIAFIVQNRADAEISWLFLDGSWPLWIVIVVSAIAGAALSEVLGWVLRRRRSAD